MTTRWRIRHPHWTKLALFILISTRTPPLQAQTDHAPAITLRLVHPDRQAAEVLKLFDGSGAKNPAELLARWKLVNKAPGSLSKPLEAAIAMFNPEMAQEWRVFDDTLVRMDPTNASSWFAVIPHDDGTLAAAITSMRLSYDEEKALLHLSQRVPVARLSKGGFPVACQTGQTILVGSSRDELLRGLAYVPPPARTSAAPAQARPAPAPRAAALRARLASNTIDSGIEFSVDSAQLVPSATASVTDRRALMAMRAIAGSRMIGTSTLADGTLTTIFESMRPELMRDRTIPLNASVVDRDWLALIPVSHLIGFGSLALDPSESGRAALFALADQIDRADPARARVAASRTRLNLLAAAFGLRPEVDLWPHWKGLTAAVSADPRDFGALSGGWLILHFDQPEVAARLLNDVAPRIAATALKGQTKSPAARTDIAKKRDPSNYNATHPMRLGAFSGLPIFGWTAESNLVLACGDLALEASRKLSKKRELSVAAVCEDWRGAGKPAPARVGALWPGRLWIPPRAWLANPATITLVDLPPIVWWGWNEPGATTDLLRWTGLRAAAKRFVQALALGDAPAR